MAVLNNGSRFTEALMQDHDEHQPLAFCDRCKKWTQMKWLPKEQRGKKVETWFECAVCGCRRLTLRYL